MSITRGRRVDDFLSDIEERLIAKLSGRDQHLGVVETIAAIRKEIGDYEILDVDAREEPDPNPGISDAEADAIASAEEEDDEDDEDDEELDL